MPEFLPKGCSYFYPDVCCLVSYLMVVSGSLPEGCHLITNFRIVFYLYSKSHCLIFYLLVVLWFLALRLLFDSLLHDCCLISM